MLDTVENGSIDWNVGVKNWKRWDPSFKKSKWVKDNIVYIYIYVYITYMLVCIISQSVAYFTGVS